MDLFERLLAKYPENFKDNWECWVPEPWESLVEDLMSQIYDLDPSIQVVQIKEKLGGLRFYHNGSHSEKVYDLIDRAEQAAEKICVQCGKPGKLTTVRGWVSALCEEHCPK